MARKFCTVENPDGPVLGYSPDSGVRILEQDGLFFKDLARTGELVPYEDWRLTPDERARDLASRLTTEQIAGLMLYSSHQMVPARSGGPFSATYGGKAFEESGAEPTALTDQQKSFLENDNIRYVLAMALENPEIAAGWNNNLQALAETLPLGIPVNTSSDPRHGAGKAGAEYKGGGGDTSKWPEGIAMAATFRPERCKEFAQTAAKEYRAMGIATALSPQVDLATEPRWMRFGDTFGEHAGLAADMGRAYCDGMQTTEGEATGWGMDSVGVMAKHWPGGGSGEGGRDAHYAYGKFAVYPGKNFDQHLKPFTEGVFQLDGPTGQTASIMPYYTVSWGQDPAGKNVGNSYSKYMIDTLLRKRYGYDGVVCTDWGITGDHAPSMSDFGSRCWGVEELTEGERHLLLLENGVDQFGGNNRIAPVLEAYRMGCEKYGEEAMRARFEQSAVRLLRGSFRCGLFENPYLDTAASAALVGCEAFARAGYQAQLESVVLLKNRERTLPLRKKIKVYVPRRHIGSYSSFFGTPTPEREFDPVPKALLERYFEPAERPEEADAAIVFVETPITDSYSAKDKEAGGNGYLPISLQYRPYHAVSAREESIAGGDPLEAFTNRSYRGKTAYAANEQDLDNVLLARKHMGNKPVIVVAQLNKPTVLAELEPYADAIVAEFGVQVQAVLDILTGGAEPSGLLPMQLPRDMETVEAQAEDVPFDMACYTDSQGNTYDFGYGLSWDGVICDERTERYHTKTDKTV